MDVTRQEMGCTLRYWRVGLAFVDSNHGNPKSRQKQPQQAVRSILSNFCQASIVDASRDAPALKFNECLRGCSIKRNLNCKPSYYSAVFLLVYKYYHYYIALANCPAQRAPGVDFFAKMPKQDSDSSISVQSCRRFNTKVSFF